jgi:hypothetical protein
MEDELAARRRSSSARAEAARDREAELEAIDAATDALIEDAKNDVLLNAGLAELEALLGPRDAPDFRDRARRMRYGPDGKMTLEPKTKLRSVD